MILITLEWSLIRVLFFVTDSVLFQELEAAIREVMASPQFGLQVDETQIKKMLQMKESIDQRIGCVVVGPSGEGEYIVIYTRVFEPRERACPHHNSPATPEPFRFVIYTRSSCFVNFESSRFVIHLFSSFTTPSPGSGKTTVWQILQAAMIKCGQPVKTYIMNPKAMPRLQLLGFMDHDTREWTDGVLTDASRKVVIEPSNVRSWIVCDGDVDPEWIESLNSVLDDNHLLTLPNGERIAFGDNVNFLFETHDLRFASPATVSRMGMIFLSEDDIDVRRVCKKWLKAQPESTREVLESLLDEFFYKALERTMKMDFIVETTLVGTVSNGLSQLVSVDSKAGFICGLVRGLGGNLSVADRSLLAKELYELAMLRQPDPNKPLDCYCDDGSLVPFYPSSDPESLSGGEPLTLDSVIPTVSVQRTLTMMHNWVENMEPFILVGPEGCGKDMIIRQAFKQRRSTSITTLNCNAQTTAGDVISKISQTCSLFSAPEGRVYRPRDSER